MSDEAVKYEEWKPSINPWITIIPTMLAVFIYALDGTIANVALPHMAGSFSATRDESMWILTSYLIASGIIIPTVDWFSRLLGRKNFFILSILVFTLASMLCGMATNMETMIVARILQGAGGGGIVPITQAIFMESFKGDDRAKAMSIFGMGVILAPIIGPVLGGWITDNWSWPWIFFINVPFGCLAVILSKKFIEDPPYAKKQKNVKIDGLGLSFLIIWLITLQIVLDKGNNADWFNTPWICWMTAVSVIAAILFFISQAKRKNSLVDLSVFKNRNYAAGTLIQVVMQAVLYATLAILPQFLQGMMGYDAYLSGLSMMPRGFGSFLAMLICGNIASKVDNRVLTAIGLTLVGVGGLIFGNLNLQIANMNIMIPNFIMGFGMGFSILPLITLSMQTLRQDQMTNASGLQNLLKSVGAAIGTSLVATLLTRYAQIHQFMMVEHLNDLNPIFIEKLQTMTAAFSQVTHATIAKYMAQSMLYKQLIQQATLWAFINAFRIFGLLCFSVIPLLALMKTGKSSSSDDQTVIMH